MSGLKGRRIASFREPLAAWKIVVGVIGIACIFVGLVAEIRNGGRDRWPLYLLGFSATVFTAPRYIRFYERGLSVPKAAGEVFLSQEQLLEMKLDGDRFCVTGPDADWNGPYSGGTYRIRAKDLRNFEGVLARYQNSMRGNAA